MPQQAHGLEAQRQLLAIIGLADVEPGERERAAPLRMRPERDRPDQSAERDDEEKRRMMAWNLTAQTIMHVDAWKAFFAEVGYTGDYYWFIP